jgi:hypothetical protein
MRKLFVALGAAVLALVLTPVANAQERTLTTFVVQLSAENEVPECQAAVDSGASGVAVVQINAETGEISYRVVAFRLPGTVTAAHIHPGAVGEANPPAQGGGFEVTGLSTGLVAEGSTMNPTLAAAILANPENYYVNVHTTAPDPEDACPGGAVRGQLG